MNRMCVRVVVATALVGLAWSPHAMAINLPGGFTTEALSGPWAQPVLIRFTPDGGWTFVVEKAGRIWVHDGTKKGPFPMVDRVAEVNNDHDRGLLGFVEHPNWVPDGGPNSWIYMLYTVAPIYGQDNGFNKNGRYSFSRVTRCRTHMVDGWPVTIDDDEDGDGAACQTLIGHRDNHGKVNDGITSLHNSHATGDLHFGTDGTLLVLNGDGAHYNFQDNGGKDPQGFQNYALTPPPGELPPWFGPMPLYEDSGAFRVQDLRSLAGKVLRIDPETGLGLPTNPYFTGDPADHRSKVWAGGLRNPFRSSIRPGSGSADPADAKPGTVYYGEVGWGTWEHIGTIKGGENRGWPRFEGHKKHGGYSNFKRGSNPLGMPDGQDFGAPADPPEWKIHSPPLLSWHHKQTGALIPSGLHPGFKGNCAVGGDFYQGGSYPDVYDGAWFFADYGQSWIRVLYVDEDDNPIEVKNFASAANGPVDITTHPITQDLYYISIKSSQIFRIRYGTNAAPAASLVGDPLAGAAPLVVSLDASGTTDPDQPTHTLTYDWSFGDGTSALDAGPAVSHTFAKGDYTVVVTVTDFDGAQSTAQVDVSADNTPPVATITFPADGQIVNPDELPELTATGTGADAQDGPGALLLEWDVWMHHVHLDDPSADHTHPVAAGTGTSVSFSLDHAGNPLESGYYEITLTVTDTNGAKASAKTTIGASTLGVHPWKVIDIGAIAEGKDIRAAVDGFIIKGAGAGPGSTADAMRYVYRPVTGSFSLTVRLASLSGGTGGLVARTSTEADAIFLGLLADAAGLAAERRLAAGAPSETLASVGGPLTPDQWLKVERTGDTLVMSASADGSTWSEVYSGTLALPDTILIGMVSASGDPGSLGEADYENVDLQYTAACSDFVIDPGEVCDDGNLTDGDCCSSACQPEPAGTPCGDDGNPCTVLVCADIPICQTLPGPGLCEDGDACTTGDVCFGGACNSGSALDCDDENPCTDDSCDPAVGCVATPNTVPCDDGDACTENTSCNAGSCEGSPVVCTDGKQCTIDGCDSATGCTFTNDDGAACQDGEPCTGPDLCDAGACLSGPPVDCDDDNPCTDDSCESGVGCGSTPNTAGCDDGDACTTADTCADAVCIGGPPPVCDDGNPCTDDGCNPESGCTKVANSVPCDDLNACTTGDQCGQGLCAGTPTVDCDDDNPCTDDSCVPAVGCLHLPNALLCDDGNPCTTADTCTSTVCVGAPTDCDDGNTCTVDGCDPAVGCTEVPLEEGDACDDGDACTTDGTCLAGDCDPGSPLDCDDGSECTLDTCEEGLGCTYENVEGPCDDGHACTIGDSCQDGACIAADALTCDDGNGCTDDYCHPTSGCLFVANEAWCDDGDACTKLDACAAGDCQGAPLDCGDDNPCTVDSCGEGGTCVHGPSAEPCDDGDACTTSDGCQAGACAGVPLPCDDGDPCTDDACDPTSGCTHQPNPDACAGPTDPIGDPGTKPPTSPPSEEEEESGTTSESGCSATGSPGPGGTGAAVVFLLLLSLLLGIRGRAETA